MVMKVFDGDPRDGLESERMPFNRIRVEHVSKRHGRTMALSDVELTLDAGRLHIIEGPNGSGKSTLLSLLALLSRPTTGAIRYGEHEGQHERNWLHAHIGLLSHEPMVYPDLSGFENLWFAARLAMLKHPEHRIIQLCEQCDLGEWVTRPARTYSRGQLQRLSLARTLIHVPKLLLLDEPTVALDHSSSNRVVNVVKAEATRGAIVVVVTHDVELISALGADAKRFRLEQGRLGEAA